MNECYELWLNAQDDVRARAQALQLPKCSIGMADATQIRIISRYWIIFPLSFIVFQWLIKLILSSEAQKAKKRIESMVRVGRDSAECKCTITMKCTEHPSNGALAHSLLMAWNHSIQAICSVHFIKWVRFIYYFFACVRCLFSSIHRSCVQSNAFHCTNHHLIRNEIAMKQHGIYKYIYISHRSIWRISMLMTTWKTVTVSENGRDVLVIYYGNGVQT